MFSRRVVCAVIITVLVVVRSPAQEEPSTTVHGFVDVYYAYSFGNSVPGDRSFTTQPLRKNEFNLNLAMIDVKHGAERIRGRFALQTGTYVQANLAAEPSLLKNILEASAGTRLGEDTWIDIGIFPSHIGFEGILSKDNWTYSRSLIADYSPYYEAGISVTMAPSEHLTVRGLVVNGWQNILETNGDKAVGTQVAYKPSESVLFHWSTFLGNEQPDSVASRIRIFNDLFAQLTLSEEWSIVLAFDFGFQKQAGRSSYDDWQGASFVAKHTFNNRWSMAGRAEYFSDTTGVIVPTGTANNFQTVAGSLNIDFAPVTNLVWRIEGRVSKSKDAIYPSETGLKKTDSFVVLSAAISL